MLGRRHDQLAVQPLPREAGERVEQVAQVGGEARAGGEQPTSV
jgi:hypothetical protein